MPRLWELAMLVLLLMAVGGRLAGVVSGSGGAHIERHRPTLALLRHIREGETGVLGVEGGQVE